LLDATTNYVLKVKTVDRVKKERCKCLAPVKCCYLYTFKVDSILFIESEKDFTEIDLKNLRFFSTEYDIFRSGTHFVGEFADTETDNYIHLNRMIPTGGNRILSFDKEFTSLVGRYNCETYRRVPFEKYFRKRYRKESGVPPREPSD
jgi:hypothetical protein